MLLEKSKEIINKAIKDYKPKAIFMMFSGGDDSRCAYEVATALNIPLTHFVFGNTRTGIPDTTDYVREFSLSSGLPYIEADAGEAYEDYVTRKGFFGRGEKAHSFAYHVIKASQFRKAASSIRHRRRNFNILLINGARQTESENRSKNLTDIYNVDPAATSNIWVNIIHHWEKKDCLDFLADCKSRRNPVTEALCRSGECMCGTMQSKEERNEAAFFFPEWGRWLDDIRRRVMIDKGFTWDWGEHISNYAKAKMNGQMEFEQFADFTPEFQPACMDCIRR